MEHSTFLETASNLSLEQKIGQLVLAQTFGRFRGSASHEYKALQQLVMDYHISGFKLYHGYAFGTLMLTGHIQKAATPPLFIASDLECGLGQQINDAPRLPPIAALGAINDSQLAQQAGFVTAREALQLGINLIFAPLLDLHTEEDKYFGLRSIGKDPTIVSQIGSEFILGLSRAGALSTAKYFPGNGSQIFCNDGSTLNLQSYTQLSSYEWMPFRAAISAGVDAVMLSHGAFPHLDDTKWDSDAGAWPAALSPRIIQGFLREHLSFDGLVVTDALNLPFLHKHSIRKIAYYAIAAGADLLVALTTPQDAIEAIKGIYDALDSGKVTEGQINSSVGRILRAKSKIKQMAIGASWIDIPESIGSDQTVRTIEEIARRSVRLIRIPPSGFPIRIRPITMECLVIGSNLMLEQIKTDRWVPWHKFEDLGNVSITWRAIIPNDPKPYLPQQNWLEFIVISLLQSDLQTRETLEFYLEFFQKMEVKVILALPIAPNAAKFLSSKAWASIWLPDFQQASRHALFSVIFGELESEGFLS